MKTKAIVATLLIAAAASADARFAWPYPRKTLSPDEIDYWMVIKGNPWPPSAEAKLATWNTRRGEASPSGGGPERRKIAAKQEGREGPLPAN
jgi:hypothetical protein